MSDPGAEFVNGDLTKRPLNSGTPRRWSYGCTGPRVVLFLSAGLFALGLLVLRPVTATRGPARASQCGNNLKQLGLALHNYQDEYGSFPPAYMVDDDGQPIHSWRTLILPFFDQVLLHRQYRFDESWNGPRNRTLHERIYVSTRGCPSDPEVYRSAAGTNYVAVVGPETAWPGDRSVAISDITDGYANTILLVELSPALANWFEPRDLEFESMSFRIDDPVQPSLSSHHATEPSWPWQDPVPFVHVLLVDGSVKRLPVSTPSETVSALLTIAGGENVDVHWIED